MAGHGERARERAVALPRLDLAFERLVLLGEVWNAVEQDAAVGREVADIGKFGAADGNVTPARAGFLEEGDGEPIRARGVARDVSTIVVDGDFFAVGVLVEDFLP